MRGQTAVTPALIAASALAMAQPGPGFKAEVHLVRVPCSVTDSSGATIAGLTQRDFVVEEDGRPRRVKYLWRESDLPLTIGLIVDVSGSQIRLLQQHQQTVHRFLSRAVTPADRAFLVSVQVQQRLVTDLTSAIEALESGTRELGTEKAEILGDPCCSLRVRPRFGLFRTPRFAPCLGTSLWNGVYFAAKLKLKPQTGRKAMLVITDGWDTGSDHGLSDAIEASQSADTVLYSIRYVDPSQLLPNTNQPVSRWTARGIRRNMEKIFAGARRDLKRISEETGGEMYEGDPATLPATFDRIETALRTQYVLGYEQSSTLPGYHRIQVKVRRRNVRVRARSGYYAQ